jgi:hypothetical protein
MKDMPQSYENMGRAPSLLEFLIFITSSIITTTRFVDHKQWKKIEVET